MEDENKVDEGRMKQRFTKRDGTKVDKGRMRQRLTRRG